MRIIFIKICPYKGHAKDSVRDAAGSEKKLQVSLPPLQPRLKKKYIPECIVGILKSHRHLLPTPDVHTADTPPPRSWILYALVSQLLFPKSPLFASLPATWLTA